MKNVIAQYKLKNVILENLIVMLRDNKPLNLQVLASLMIGSDVRLSWNTYCLSFNYDGNEILYIVDVNGVMHYNYKKLIRKLEAQIEKNLDYIDNIIYCELHEDEIIKKHNDNVKNLSKMYRDIPYEFWQKNIAKLEVLNIDD